ncbi:MAG: ATP-binding cassette domain-containing protein [Pseudomonadota bacterium]
MSAAWTRGEACRAAAEPALAVEGISHRFGAVQALDAVSLTVPAGRVTALVGINGAGKTTLFNLVTRLYAARSGRIAVCGHELARTPRAALAAMGVVFQSRALDPTLTVRQNLAYRGALYGMPRRAALTAGGAALERLGLADRMATSLRALSGGQARRVEIAAALMHAPRLLLCDEATVGLDLASRRALVADIHRLAADTGVGVLWATHLMDEVEPGDRTVVLHRGRVLAEAEAAALAPDGDIGAAFLALTAQADA